MPTATWSVEAYIDASMEKVSNPDGNYGTSEYLYCHVWIIDPVKLFLFRAIMNFDLSGFPGDVADITAANLTVEVVNNGDVGHPVHFERCTQPEGWSHYQVTWNDRLTSTPWAAGGGEKTDVDRVTTAVPASLGVTSIPGFKPLVDDAFALRNSRLSLIVSMDNEGEEGITRQFNMSSREHPTDQKPTLTITYDLPVIAQPTGHRSVPRSSFGEAARTSRHVAPASASTGARTARPSRPQRRRPR